jgi:Spy/CpxP family protein refolding chaperone
MNRAAMITGTIVLLSTASAMAQQPSPHPSPDSGFASRLFPPELVMQQQRRLGLTAEQRDRITAAIKELQGQVIDFQWRMQDEEQRLTGLLDQPSVDATAALAQVDRLLEIERQIKKAHLGLLIKIKNVLTPEQQETLRQVRAPNKDAGRP